MDASLEFSVYLSNFKLFQPGESHAQVDLLDRLARSYARHQGGEVAHWRKRLARYGCDAEQVDRRVCVDLSVVDNAAVPLIDRQRTYERVADEAVSELCRGESFDELLHVTCTGYSSPSAAQRHILRTGGGASVLHLYHMGCYAAFPALRVGATMAERGRKARIAHTELCTLHFHPSDEPQSLVIQTLFADGAIAYTLTAERPTLGLELLRSKESLIPESVADMEWVCASPAFRMTLSRDVPRKIADNIGAFHADLIRGHSFRRLFYAVHPGGPRILDLVAETLQLAPEQLEHSRRVLFERGNMSSATAPTIWDSMLSDPRLQTGDGVVSFAFGPGLTVCGSLMRVCKA
jgi:predicted naringenin-chalcone synthase